MSSRPAPGSGMNYCPHCGAELSETLAEHMGRGACGGHHAPANDSKPRSDLPPEPEIEPPTLDNHDEREHPPDDLDERRALADELAEEDVWV